MSKCRRIAASVGIVLSIIVVGGLFIASAWVSKASTTADGLGLTGFILMFALTVAYLVLSWIWDD